MVYNAFKKNLEALSHATVAGILFAAVKAVHFLHRFRDRVGTWEKLHASNLSVNLIKWN